MLKNAYTWWALLRKNNKKCSIWGSRAYLTRSKLYYMIFVWKDFAIEKDISKKEIIKFLYRCKKNYKLSSEDFKPIFKEYLMANDIGYFAILSALNLALEKKEFLIKSINV